MGIMLTIFILFTSLYIISANADSTPCNKDIGILIDTSLSIPQRKLEVLLETFLKPFYDKFEISAQKTQFGLITFDKYSRLRFTLADNISTIEPVRHFMTRIDLALLQAKNKLFTSSAGDRKDKQNVLLVITDGKPFPAKTFLLFKKSLALLRAQNVNIFAVGYGVEANINTTVLKEIGGDNVLIMNEDKTLGYAPFVDPIKNMVCIPDPVAFFPLNAAYGTKEINNRAVKGIPRGVTLAPGPDGRPNHSYKFSGSSNSYIEFPNRIGGPLDVRYSMTMLCWVYYGKDGPLFSYEKGSTWGVHLWVVHGGKLFVRFVKRDYSSTNHLVHTNLAGGWKFVGASYDRSSGEAKLWVNGAVVQTLNIGAGLELATQDSIRIGVKTGDGRYFKGRIAQMRIYNRALTQEQIQAIQKLVVAA